ncbi:hypothetical protein N9R81_04630 [Flavobacteriales bacterium]|nr:hypothetical protein [Flavobacteriales bacterium]
MTLLRASLYLFFISLLAGATSHAQPNKINNDYIALESSNPDKLLRKGKIKSGYFIQGTDTTFTFLLDIKNKNRSIANLVCIEVLNEGTIHNRTATDIDYYSVNDKKYVKHISQGNHFFIEEMVEGDVKLYLRAPIPSDPRELFYLQFEGDSIYKVLETGFTDFKMYTLPTSSGNGSNSQVSSTMAYTTNNDEEKFKAFIAAYFGSCPIIVNMVKSDIYTISDMPAIVKKYNNCSTN